MKINTSSKDIDAILNRGVIAEILPTKKGFRQKLLGGKKLRFYLGIDPTSTSLHLGHAENIMLLEDFRSLGHEVVLLIGDFTAKIGDPSEKLSARKVMSDKEITKNANAIKKQLGALLNFKDKYNPAKIDYNSKWLGKLKFADLLELASNFTVGQMIERDMFKKRIKARKPIFFHEFFYPLMQGYDSVGLDTDVEIGGTDQTFNMLAGRTLLKRLKNKEKFIITNNLLENPKTGELMSKSTGAGVFLSSGPSKMFGEIMAQPDEIIEMLFITNTRLPLQEVKKLVKQSKKGGKHAKDIKIQLAKEIVSIYHKKPAAKNAKESFEKTFTKGELPKDVKEFKYKKSSDSILNILVMSGLASSKTEARRFIENGAVEINGEKEKDPIKKIDLKSGITLKVGKHRFLRIKN